MKPGDQGVDRLRLGWFLSVNGSRGLTRPRGCRHEGSEFTRRRNPLQRDVGNDLAFTLRGISAYDWSEYVCYAALEQY